MHSCGKLPDAARPEWSSFCGAQRSKRAGTEDGKAAQIIIMQRRKTFAVFIF